MNTLLRRFLLPVIALTLCWQPPALAQNKFSELDGVHNLLRGYFLAAQGDYRTAAPILGEIGVAFEDAVVMQSATQIALRAGNIKLARAFAASWVSFGGGARARQTEAELLLVDGDLPRAEKLLSGLMQDGAQTPEELRRQLAAVSDSKQAVDIGRRLFAKDIEGYYHFALLALEKGDFTTADDAATKALAAADDERLDVLFLAGRVAQRARGDSAPLPLLRQYVTDGCAPTIKHCTLDGVLWAFSNYLRDGEEWDNVLRDGKADSQTWAVSAGNWYLQWDMPDEARAAYERGGETFMARFGMAELAEQSGDIDGALALLLTATVADSRELVVRENTIAHLLSEKGDIAGALERIASANKTVPDNFTLMYQESLLLEQSGDVEAALAVLRRLAELFPTNPDVWNALGYVMADHSIDLPTAKKFIERALQGKPNDANVIDSMGWVQYRLGNLPAALLQLKRAAGLSKSPEIYAHYGEVLWESGDTGEARRVWQEAKGFAPDNKVLNDTLQRYQPF